ncbi:pyruvate dehydrogenase (acetyl-transferring), homodimeric type [Halieaceae bacterium IMCC14734]|uniref:Pyruvate dehydrogenase E1 component n=1 Tax=Candidatus Litorirhabdus singularis TaxID=2518993 RepID=A0ABT3TF08_9GAMM|nr:pyruvate dehydrogenase (acetyl-transferring), homodimeric type [Candidatus Litorirhabdus singularis]MCX2980775.1 pyruvate dehydrogenase (acetyl-transferring), homodimeric type [Candidatus Litorirhabdus singularis]
MSEQPFPGYIDELAEDRNEWIESLENIYREYGEAGVRDILRSLQNHVLTRGIALSEATLNTPYVNTIPPSEQAPYPGNIALEKRIENIIRWNAMAMVLQAVDQGRGVGGHIATYASAATMLEVGFQHFFRSRSEDYGGDLVMPQPHAAPGIYARAFLEGRFDGKRLANYRRELADGGGLSSYPHPRSMPDFWQLPNASMGLSTPTAIYQARFAKYLENRGLKPRTGGKIWCYVGDGESDEPEVLGTINIAARDKLDNLVLIVNCNLQRLDGPVRGNGKIIQELERSFRGADWNVIKVIWGSGWDGLLAQDTEGILRQRMEDCVDGDYQRYSIMAGDAQREHWVDGDPALEQMMNSLTNEELREIKRGGQDPKKIFAAYQRAATAQDKPTVILIKTVKGDGMGESAQGRNTAHQKKNLNAEERLQLASDYAIPLSESEIKAAAFYRPAEDSAEMVYLQQQRENLGGYLPQRTVECPPLQAPSLDTLRTFLQGTGEREASTTMAVVRMLGVLMKDAELGKYIVPIVPDEARTFGMDGLFKVNGIYSPEGQNYTPVDAESLLSYREATDGQILQEGICETGAMASFLAAGTAYAVHGVPTIPFYIFYSMFGFQRVGDMIWSCADMMCRGFLLGGTAGRTTLNGEGLQHQDGHSHVLASTVPNLKSYDPAFAYELAIIVRDGIYRMYELQENIFYYLTVYNENHVMPAMASDTGVDEGVLRGAYCWQRSTASGPEVHLLASGSIMQQAIAAAQHLQQLGYAAHIWSITSYTELAREAEACERYNRLHPLAQQQVPYIQQLFADVSAPVVAVSDYMKALPNSIARWMPPTYTVLGTDGYGLSESRAALRDHFEICQRHIVQATLVSLHEMGSLSDAELKQAMRSLDIDADKPDPALR